MVGIKRMYGPLWTMPNGGRAHGTQMRLRIETQVMVAMDTPSDKAWEHLGRLLDEGMRRLRVRDQDAVLLRYFEGKRLRDVGKQMGISEAAARTLTAGALEKCRGYFGRRGIRLSDSELAALLTARAVDPAPKGLATAVSRLAMRRAAEQILREQRDWIWL